MKTLIPSIALLIASATVGAQDLTTVQATNSDISENLDLKAVAAVFGEANDLDDFERKLNDPDLKICNLDLNGDGFVDYLRVIETSEGGTHLVVIQAVLGQDVFQDVATVDVERDDRGATRVQVVGDVYMYGPNYIIEPVYVQQPVIYVFFWGPRYRPWHSPYYWGYYPSYYNPWNPYPVYTYHQHVHVHIHRHPGNSYGYVGHRHSRVAGEMHRKVYRNDYGAQHPDRSFAKRNAGVTNRQALEEKKSPSRSAATAPNSMKDAKLQTRPVDKQFAPGAENKSDRQQTTRPVDNRRETAPATKSPAVRPEERTAQPERSTQSAPERTREMAPERQSVKRAEPRQQERPEASPSPRQEQQREQREVAPAPRPERQSPQQKMDRKSEPSKAAPKQGNKKGRGE